MTDFHRRELLSGAMALAASALQAAPEEREIRTAVVGVGHRGTALLGQVLRQENVRVNAICDIDPQARDQALSASSRFNPRSFTDYRQVLELKEGDPVVVATPCYFHDRSARSRAAPRRSD